VFEIFSISLQTGGSKNAVRISWQDTHTKVRMNDILFRREKNRSVSGYALLSRAELEKYLWQGPGLI
jgi:hypothetical protein